MTGWIENDALRFMGLNDIEIATLNMRLPDLLNLIIVGRNHADQLHRVLTDLSPIAEKLIKFQQELGR